MAFGTAACSGSKSDDNKPNAAGSSSSSTAPGTTTSSSASSTGPEEKLPDLTAAQVVTAFAGKGYKCSTDEAYQTCAQGVTSIQVLIGKQPRPPVISLQATGVAAEAATKLSDFAPQALELAHVNPRGQIADWLKQQQSKASAQTTAGDWTVEFSTEADTDQPGAILTLTDKLCKVDCGAE
ncbi:hypothetical protein [Kribbella jiaozuonensis]|uniref:Lipoprotein n=1 Tax=Kribbella jiaozuonensis TaxID=2575441 RepID=A0A4U3LLR2_9ACTN|nr:hypothetical protein [Kribbella jiaozuonensis]TKK75336.1 hypothetical protein FDA38_33555 [Kribbella jiaozuonensis]